MTITVNIPAHHLERDREIHIYLPPGYDESPDTSYPVLYMHDGQNIFSDTVSTVGMSWNIDLTADRLIEEGKIEELIIVGVSNTEWRDDEYTPTYDHGEESGGYADHYLKYLLEDVKPFVDENFRTKPFRQDTGICGSSLGGLLSIYAALEHPDQFGKVAAISPSLWWDDRAIFDLASRWDRKGHEFLFWLDMGMNEADDDEDEGSDTGEGDSGDVDDQDISVEDDTDGDPDFRSNDDPNGPDDDDTDYGQDTDEDFGSPAAHEDGADDDEYDDDEDEDEDEEVDPIEDARDFRDLLLSRGFTLGEDLMYFEDAWGFHDEVSWGQRVEKVLVYLFGTGWDEDHWPWD